MKIRAFRIVLQHGSNINNLLQYISDEPLSRRVAATSSGEISLKEVRQMRTGEWLLDFTKFRHTGPGRAPRGAPNADFDLAEDEFFGEETAAVYYPSTNVLVIQYNQHGPRSSSIEQYLQHYVANLLGVFSLGFSSMAIHAIMRADQAAKFRAMRTIKTIKFKMYVPGVLQQPQERRQSLSGVLTNNIVPEAQSISVSIDAGRSRSFTLRGLRDMVSDLSGLGDDVTQLTVTGRGDVDEPPEILDLLEAQLSSEMPIQPTSRRRQGLAERLAALRSAYDEWRDGGQI